MDHTTELLDFKLRKDKEKGYLINAQYKIIWENGSIDIECIHDFPLHVSDYRPIINYMSDGYHARIHDFKNMIICNFGFGDISASVSSLPDDWHVIHRVKDPDPLELTLEDIEKKFGRKVKIVNKKGD